MDAVIIRSIIGHQSFDRQIDFTNQQAVGVAVDHRAQLGNHRMDVRLIGRMPLQEAFDVGLVRSVARVRWIVAKLRILDQVPDHVDPETIHALVEPEAQNVLHRRAHILVAPVEVGLFGEKSVVIILAARLVPLPGAAAEIAHPVVGRAAAWRRITPDIPVAFRVITAGTTFLEPGMTIRAMIGHEVEQQLQPARMRFRQQPIEHRHVAEQRIDGPIVRYVIAKVRHGRTENGGKPDRADAQVRNMIEPLANTRQVAHSVTTAILKGSGVDLIKGSFVPPAIHRAFLPTSHALAAASSAPAPSARRCFVIQSCGLRRRAMASKRPCAP